MNKPCILLLPVPPSKMVITDDKGDVKQAIVGPYVEGDTFTLKCDVTGGKSYISLSKNKTYS